MPHVLTMLIVLLFGLMSFLGSPALAEGTSDGSGTAAGDTSAYADAKAAVDTGNFAAALPMLVLLTNDDPGNADAWNLLGFTHRRLGQLDEASTAYLTVLRINPNHLGALEYQGELFIQTGALDKARTNLEKLKSLCGDCEQYGDLEKALKAAGA